MKKNGFKGCFCSKAFTLIELLVVVLIIGILAAVALPQYKVATTKVQLAKYLPMIKAIYQAEEAFYLANGAYTRDLPSLDIEFPLNETCVYAVSKRHSHYDCEDVSIGVYNDATNVQVHTHNIAYLYYLRDEENTAVDEELKKGDILCLAVDDIAKKVCRSLGPIKKEKEIAAAEWRYLVILQ